MSARDVILGRLGLDVPPDLAGEAARLIAAPERPDVLDDDLLAPFLRQISAPAFGATSAVIESLSALPEAVAAYLREQGLPPALYIPPDPAVRALDWTEFALTDCCAVDQPAVLAVARAGVAETGSLVLETAAAAPMLPNFLALHHIVLVPRAAIVRHLEDIPAPGHWPRAHYWVTGVSGTTDIEGQYVRGAHGPRFLHVIVTP